MIQSLKLLQVNTLQLEQILKNELEMNPVLETVEDPEDNLEKETDIDNNNEKEGDLEVAEEQIDWEEFKNLQLSVLKASTPDLEGPTDHGITSALYKVACEHGIRHILIGSCFKTEGKMPSCWGYADGKYLKNLLKMFGNVPLRTYPNMMFSDIIYYNSIKRIKAIKPLYYIPYHKKEIKKLLEEELRWKDYGGHRSNF